MSSFWSRILVAVAALPVVLGLVYLGGWWLFGLALVGGLIGLHEYASMTRSLHPLVLACYVGLIAILLAVVLDGGLPWMMAGLELSLLLAFVLHGVGRTRHPATIAIASTLLGTAWVGLGLGHLLLLRDLPEHGRLVIFTVLLAVFAADTLAYFGGRLLGRHKLAPVISPGKTWEGFVIGTAAAVAVSFFALYDDRDTFLAIWQAVVLGLVVAVSAALGDLFESTLKRDMQIKDTGRLLAGHGGVLDRVDSLLFAGPAAFYLLLAYGFA